VPRSAGRYVAVQLACAPDDVSSTRSHATAAQSSVRDRRVLDPPPIVQLRLFELAPQQEANEQQDPALPNGHSAPNAQVRTEVDYS
jgi:hypothetical protein